MALPLLLAGLQGVGTALNVGSTLYNSNMNAKAIMRQARADAENILEQGRQVVQSQRLITSASGFINTAETSNYQLMLDTEKEAKRQANRIMELAKKQAKATKKGGLFGAIGGLLSGGASAGSYFSK